MKETGFGLSKATLPVMEQMAEQLPGGFVLYKGQEEQEILFVNRPLLDIYECETVEEFRELTGFTFPGMVHPEDRERVLNSIDNQIAGQYGAYDHVEYRVITKAGLVHWIGDYGYFSYSEDFGDVFYVFLFDITDKIQAQEAKNRFFSAMSHQLLTPMNAVSTFIKLALSHKGDPEALEKYLTSADEAASHMVKQIDRLVEVHRQQFSIESNEETVERQTPLRILIAEDNEMNQMLLQTILEEYSFLVEIADDGDVAVEAVRSHEPGYYDVILMDIQMNRMNGHEAAVLIRQLPWGDKQALPIIAISANSRDEDIERSQKSGINDHLAKPYDPEQILEAIRRYTRKGNA